MQCCINDFSSFGKCLQAFTFLNYISKRDRIPGLYLFKFNVLFTIIAGHLGNILRATCSMERMRNRADTQLLLGFVVPLPKSEVTRFFSKVDTT
jgi:hypothetical protein